MEVHQPNVLPTTVQPPVKMHQCKNCGYATRFIQNLRRHYKQRHLGRETTPTPSISPEQKIHSSPLIMPPKRKRPVGTEERPSEEREVSPSAVKRRKKSLHYDPLEMCQEIYETLRNYKTEDGRIMCETFIRAPKRRTAADYYEVVSTPIDLLRIQQKLKTEEYEEIDQFSADIELMVNNAKAYYKKGSQEYQDASDMWDLFVKSKDDLISDTFKDVATKPERKRIKPEDDDDDTDDSPNKSTLNDSISSIDDRQDEIEDFEQLFAAVITARDDDREISAAFQLLPQKSKYPEYYQIIRKPIDLKMIATKIQDNQYRVIDEMEKDMALMVKNAKTFNEPKSLIYKDAVALKKIFQNKKVEISQKKQQGIAKKSERARTRERSIGHHLAAACAAMTYPSDEESEIASSQDTSSQPDLDDEDSGAETFASEEENPYWTLLNAVKIFRNNQGVSIYEPFLKLPSKRFYPDYYEEIKTPMSLSNVKKKLKFNQYRSLESIFSDLNLVFENAKHYNADESKIYQDAVILQRVVWQKKQELEREGHNQLDELSASPYGYYPATKVSRELFDEDSHQSGRSDKDRGRRSSGSGAPDSDRKRIGKRSTPEEMMRRRILALYRAVYEYTDSDGRLLRTIFMELPSKRDYPDYYRVIVEPIDLKMIENKVKVEKYTNEQQLMADFELMFNNARHYNEEESLVYKDADRLHRVLKAKWRAICQNIEARRALCNKNRMRIKTVTTLASKLQDLYDTMLNYQDTKGRTLSSPFLKLPLKTDYPDYYEVIKKPIDLQKIQQKVTSSQYETVEDMVADLVQMFDNACKYNEPDSLLYKDALTLQRVCLEKKVDLVDEKTNEVPDVKAILQELMTSLFISVYNYQDEEGRCYSDSFAELPERDPEETLEASKEKEKPLTFDQIKKNLDRGRYRRMDRFQEDMIKVFQRARRLSRTDSQLYEDAIEMEMYFIKTRDEVCKNGEILLTPALSYTEKHLSAQLELEKQQKLAIELKEDEEKRSKRDSEERQLDATAEQTEGCDSFKYKELEFKVGEFVYIEPREKGIDPHIMCIEKLYTDSSGVQMLHGNWFYRPNETFHLATRKFLEKEVFKSDFYTSIPLTQIIGKCYVMHVKEYFKYKPEGYSDKDVYVCESRYTQRHKCFKKIKVWQTPKTDLVNIILREKPLIPVRVESVFADKEKKEDVDDGETGVLEKIREDVLAPVPVNVDGSTGIEGLVYFEQLNTHNGTYKLGDGVMVKSDKNLFYRVDKLWKDVSGYCYFSGPLYLEPIDIQHSPTRLFYAKELFLTTVEHAHPIDAVITKCSIVFGKDYFACRATEFLESDIYLCETKYLEDKSVKKLGKGLKKYALSPAVTDDEIYFFKKPLSVQKEPSPLLLKASEDTSFMDDDSQDGERDMTLDTSFNINTAVDFDKSAKKGKTHMKRQISGYIVYSGEIRKSIQQENPECTFGEISRIVGNKVSGSKRHPSGYILFSKKTRKLLQMETPGISFGEISRLVGVKWRNLTKEEKEKYEEKAKRIAEEQQAKQQEAERAFNESLNKSQSPWDYGSMSPGSSRPVTPGGYQGQYGYQGYPQGQTPGMNTSMPIMTPMQRATGQPGMSPIPPMAQRQFASPYQQQQPPHLGMRPPLMGSSPYPGTPQGQTPSRMTPQSSPGMPPPPLPHPGMSTSPHPIMSPGPTPGAVLTPGLPASPHAIMTTPQPVGQGQSMAPPPPPPRPPSPMFVTVPPRTQRLLHSEAYLRYIEGLNADNKYVSDWDKNLSATQENTPQVDESRLPSQWLAQGAGYHGNVTNALWALRDLMLKDTLNISRTLPFEALLSKVA